MDVKTVKIPKFDLTSEIVLRSIKILDIGWTTCAYFIMGLGMSVIIGKFIPKPTTAESDKKSTIRLFGEIILHSWLLGVIIYAARNIFPLLPWPLEGVWGFQHLKVKEVQSGAVFATTLIMFNSTLAQQVTYLKDRFAKSIS